jgi:hypothetical protein
VVNGSYAYAVGVGMPACGSACAVPTYLSVLNLSLLRGERLVPVLGHPSFGRPGQPALRDGTRERVPRRDADRFFRRERWLLPCRPGVPDPCSQPSSERRRTPGMVPAAFFVGGGRNRAGPGALLRSTEDTPKRVSSAPKARRDSMRRSYP